MKRFFFIFTFVLPVVCVCGQTNGVIRLALVSTSEEASAPADVLTTELSKDNGIQLLERNEIEKVYREQGLSGGSTDNLKLGRILGADGLLLVETFKENTNQFLNIRLIAVKPGVVLSAEKYPWPGTNVAAWSSWCAQHLEPLFPKLTVLAKDAVPISVVNLHSAIQSGEEQETERELKLLTIQRLSQERQLFVLERQKMQSLSKEKDLRADESVFWDGGYLLEGTVDQNGYSKDTITINARLTPPKGGAPLSFEVSGSRANPAKAVNSLATKVVELLKVNPTVKEWNADDEATRYFDEAKWNYRWGLLREAQEASESTWALGKQTIDVAILRLKSYLDDAPFFSKSGPARYSLPTPDPANINLAERILELFNQDTRLLIMSKPDSSRLSLAVYTISTSHDVTTASGGITSYMTPFRVTNTVSRAFSDNIEWFDFGLRALNLSDAVLQNFNGTAEMRSAYQLQLSDLRALTRETESILEANIPASRGLGGVDGNYTLNSLKWEDGGLWFDTPEEALAMYGKMLQSGFQTCDIPRATGDTRENRELPQIVAWTWEDRKRIPTLLKQFSDKMVASTNQDLQLEGLFYKLVFTPYDSSGRLEDVQNELYARIWEQRQRLFNGQHTGSLIDRIEGTLHDKYGSQFEHEEPFHRIRQNLRKDYLEHAPKFDRIDFETLFLTSYTESEVAELRPIMDSFKQRLKLSRFDTLPLDQLWKPFENRQEAEQPAKELASVESTTRLQPDSKALAVKFINWKLNLPAMNERLRPIVQSGIIRQGKLWVEIQCININVRRDDFRAAFAGIDLQTGSSETIPFPQELDLPSETFEVTPDSLYVIRRNRLERYRFQTKKWEAIPLPTDGDADIIAINGRLYLGRGDIILELEPDSQKIEILASSRRRPAVSTLDSFDRFGHISHGRDGKLNVRAGGHFFAFSFDKRAWEEVPAPLSDAIEWHIKTKIQYEKDNQPFDPFNHQTVEFQGLGGPLDEWIGPAIKLDAAEGRVVISRGWTGHWLVPKTVLVSSIEELRHFYLTNKPAVQNP